MRRTLQATVVALTVFASAASAQSVTSLLTAYPDHFQRIDGNDVVWRDGTRMRINDGRRPQDHEALLANPDIKDMFLAPYPSGALKAPPPRNADPGRARNQALFDKMYGRCGSGGVTKNLVDVVWLPKKWGKPLKVTGINGVAEKLAAVSRALDALPASFDRYLFPSAGAYVCRPIAGTDRVSAHGYGIAIDLSTTETDYWRWAKTTANANADIAYRNRLPIEIVQIFEKQGFIWGGKWYHYDSMHFEYRPELLGLVGKHN